MKRIGIAIFILCLMGFANTTYAQTITLPSDPDAAYALMSRYDNEKKYLEAYEVCRLAVESWPMNESFKTNKAYFLDLLGREDEAKVIFEEVAKSGSSKSYAWASLSRFARKAGDTDNALIYAKKANSLRTTPITLEAIAEVYRQTRQYDDAIRYFKKASSYLVGFYSDKLSEVNTKAEFQVNMSVCYLHLGKLQEAKELFEKAQKVNPECFGIYEYYAMLGDVNMAVKSLDEYLQCNEKYSRAKILKEIEKDVMKDLVKVKDVAEWKEVIKKWSEVNN
jgi:tetratricopeptide (TPR) repeat protein